MKTTKACIKLGRQSAYSTSDFIKLFDEDFKDLIGREVDKRDYIITHMANVIMELTSHGKFDLRNFD